MKSSNAIAVALSSALVFSVSAFAESNANRGPSMKTTPDGVTSVESPTTPSDSRGGKNTDRHEKNMQHKRSKDTTGSGTNANSPSMQKTPDGVTPIESPTKPGR